MSVVFLSLKIITMETTFINLRVVLCASVLYILVAFGNTCGPSEYKSSEGECCPMCNIGSVVYRDCKGDFSTTCIPCSQGTFMSEPNGLYKCFPCNNCSESRGLYIQSRCTTIKDTICDVLDGYYCIDDLDSQCHHAQKHSVCKPGQETKTPGTKRSDTVCEECPSGFYSATGLNCIRWTDCAARNEIESEAGSSIKDVTCTQKTRNRYGLIVPVSAVVVAIFCLYLKQLVRSSEPKHPIEETTPHFHPSTTHHTPEENKEEEDTTVVFSSPPIMGSVTGHKQPKPTLLPTCCRQIR